MTGKVVKSDVLHQFRFAEVRHEDRKIGHSFPFAGNAR